MTADSARPLGGHRIAAERDVVMARQQARRVAEALGFDTQDQTRIATAVSEIARNAFTYAGGGTVEFAILSGETRPSLQVRISDSGSGIGDLDAVLHGRYKSATGRGMGIRGARGLVDRFEIITGTEGTTVILEKSLRDPPSVPVAELAATAGTIAGPSEAVDLAAEIQRQNGELLESLGTVRTQHATLEQLSAELADTNRGVVALYAELDQRAEQLREASEIKSRFLSNMSHEFRTPLNSVIALSRLLLDQIDGPLLPEQEKQVQLIRKSAVELRDLVNDLLDLAKVEAGKTDVKLAEFQMGDLFGSLRAVFRPLLAQGSAVLVFDDVSALPPVTSDEPKVAQILRNLISNALKFTEQGEVRISAQPSRDGAMVEILVSDTGIGIGPDYLEAIFQEFAQAPSPLQARVKGTGLGLPLSRRLAELLGGTLAVESRPGQGSVFMLRLPAAIEPEPPDTARPCLIIDDEATARYVLRQILADLGATAIEAANGREGLRLARTERPRVIFLDVRMRGMSGFDVIEALAGPETASVPVIVVSSQGLDPEERRRLRRATAILSKDAVSRDTIHGVLGSLQAVAPA